MNAMDSARKILEVPAAGLCERCVRQELGLTPAQVYPLYGRELGAPRDYRADPSGVMIFNVGGVRRLVALLERSDVVVIEEGSPAPAIEDHKPRHQHGDRANGYQPETEG